MEYLTLLSVPVLAIVVGYMHGRNDINPDTPEGKIYYSKGENT